jgi:hypothetical protein
MFQEHVCHASMDPALAFARRDNEDLSFASLFVQVSYCRHCPLIVV